MLTFVTVAVTVIATMGAGYFASTSGRQRSVPVSQTAEGLALKVSINPETLQAGGTLELSVSLFNTLSTGLNLSAGFYNSTFIGFPVALWPVCELWPAVTFMIVRGNVSLGFLEGASLNSSSWSSRCTEGGGLNYLYFLPESTYATSIVTIAEECVPPSCDIVGGTINGESWDMRTVFAVNGYWGYPLNGSEASDIGHQFQYPEVGPVVAQHPFTPGTYTLAVSDVWGQNVVLHFTVV